MLELRPYPPFGLARVSFIGLASFLVMIGIYSSAISVSQDTKLRESIRRSAVSESKLLHNIGTAQMEQELQKRYGRPIFTDGAKWYNDACRWLRLQQSIWY